MTFFSIFRKFHKRLTYYSTEILHRWMDAMKQCLVAALKLHFRVSQPRQSTINASRKPRQNNNGEFLEIQTGQNEMGQNVQQLPTEPRHRPTTGCRLLHLQPNLTFSFFNSDILTHHLNGWHTAVKTAMRFFYSWCLIKGRANFIINTEKPFSTLQQPRLESEQGHNQTKSSHILLKFTYDTEQHSTLPLS